MPSVRSDHQWSTAVTSDIVKRLLDGDNRQHRSPTTVNCDLVYIDASQPARLDQVWGGVCAPEPGLNVAVPTTNHHSMYCKIARR